MVLHEALDLRHRSLTLLVLVKGCVKEIKWNEHNSTTVDLPQLADVIRPILPLEQPGDAKCLLGERPEETWLTNLNIGEG